MVKGGSGADDTTRNTPGRKALGDAAEARALAALQARGLTLVERNYRVARGPAMPGGEIDLIVRERDGTLVFVEVRARAGSRFGGAAASICCDSPPGRSAASMSSRSTAIGSNGCRARSRQGDSPA